MKAGDPGAEHGEAARHLTARKTGKGRTGAQAGSALLYSLQQQLREQTAGSS